MKQLLSFGIFAFLFATNGIGADPLIAVTPDGETALLYEDGTWAYQQQDETDTFDFRKIRWGMNMDQAIASEDLQWERGEVDENTRYLATRLDFLQEEAFLVFYFNMDRLFKANYIIIENHSNKTDYWRAFTRFNQALSEKYGAPNPELNGTPLWLDDLFQDDPRDWGMAIATGGMASFAQWPLERTTITSMIQGDNYDINLTVEFLSNEIEQVDAPKTNAF